jgi:hypothetical protein
MAKMKRINVSIPGDLAVALQKVKKHINVSSVCTKALREELSGTFEGWYRADPERAGWEIEHKTTALSFCSEEFVLAELREVYERVWGIQLDPANFRRKVLSIEGFVEDTGELRSGENGGRPARLYCAGLALEIRPPFYRPDNGTEWV